MTTRHGQGESATGSMDGWAPGRGPVSHDAPVEHTDSVAPISQRTASAAQAVPQRTASLVLAEGALLARGRFRIVRCIGRGGTGIVYDAWDAQREQRVALKLLSRSESRHIYRLKNEFRALADIVHENVVRLHELFAEDETWFFS